MSRRKHALRCYILRPDGIILPERNARAWREWFEVESNRRIRYDEVGGVYVSTIFLGIDHNFLGKGPPVLFETVILTDDDCSMIGRAISKLAAIDMHDSTLKRVRDMHAAVPDALNLFNAIRKG